MEGLGKSGIIAGLASTVGGFTLSPSPEAQSSKGRGEGREPFPRLESMYMTA